MTILQLKVSSPYVIKALSVFQKRALTTKLQIIMVFALLFFGTTNVHANAITEVLSGSDNGFGFSGLHHATGCKSMCGSIFSDVSLSEEVGHNSYFHANDLTSSSNFLLYLTLDHKNDSLLILSGSLNFDVAIGELIGTLNADFSDNNIHEDTVFKFVKGTINAGGVNVPKPNGIEGDLLSLWGANSSEDPLQGSIGFDTNTADLGLDLVVRWANVPEPSSIFLMSLGLMPLVLRRRSSKQKGCTLK